MARFEITGCATDVFACSDIQIALRKAGAKRVGKRHAFGWSNQPMVATFTAESEREARKIAECARDLLGRPGSLPALLPFEYRP